MERANGLTVLDPAVAHRAIGVRTTAEQGVKLAAIDEKRDPEAIDLDRVPVAFFQLVCAANLDESGQDFLLCEKNQADRL
jgi:hypothetical protein